MYLPTKASRFLFSIAITLLISATTEGQQVKRFADRIQKTHRIPELGYAVVSADSVYVMHISGVRKAGTNMSATLHDRFRIGSNTKAITGMIAAMLVKEHKLSWDTKFFDIFPEMRAKAKVEYRALTLLDLLTFRTKLFSYTYTYAKPTKEQFSGNADKQRYQFTQWFFQQTPVHNNDSINFSNLGYIAAGLMLEKVSGKTYRQLVADLGSLISVQFGFGRPNAYDTLQTWGHDGSLVPESHAEDYKLDWLEAAGNINCTLPDYVRFIQSQLKGLQGRSDLLSQSEFNFLHYGRTRFAVGWFWATDPVCGVYSYNIGNPGSYLTKVYVFKDLNRAFILFANAQTNATDEGLDVLYNYLRKHYLR